MSNLINNNNMKNNNNLNEDFGITAAIASAVAIVGGSIIGVNYATKSHEDQKMIETDKGFFEPKMYIGDQFIIRYYNGDEDAYEAMNLQNLKEEKGWEIYRDDYGDYIKIESQDERQFSMYGGTVRLYLPKKEWFSQFKGKIKTISDAVPGKTEHNIYSLCFYLKNPSQALKVRTTKPDGSEYFGPPQNIFDATTKTYVDDPSRGWEVLNNYKTSGYFQMGPDKLHPTKDVMKESHKLNEADMQGGTWETDPNIPSTVGTKKTDDTIDEKIKQLEQKMNSLTSEPSHGLIEYEWESYGVKYGKSEFDTWYNSSNGTWIVIGTQIATAIATAPFAAAWALKATTSVGKLARYYTIAVGSELLVGAPEAIYLYNEGYTSQAALVAFCCFLPFLTESTFFGRLIKLPANYNDLVEEIIFKSKNKSLSPADVKKWLDGLDEPIKKQVIGAMDLCANHYTKAGTKTAQQEILKSIESSLKDMMKATRKTAGSELHLGWKAVTESPARYKKFLTGSMTLKMAEINAIKLGTSISSSPVLSTTLGISLPILLIGGVLLPICALAIGDDEEFLNDPQNILVSADKSIRSLETVSKKNGLLVKEKIDTLVKEIKFFIEKENLQKSYEKSNELFGILKDLSQINDEPDLIKTNKETFQQFTRDIIQLTLIDLKKKYFSELNKGNFDEAKKHYDNANNIDPEEAEQWRTYPYILKPSTYLEPKNGFIDHTGKKHTLTHEIFVEFIKWFCGYDINTKSGYVSNSYLSRKNISFTFSFYTDKRYKDLNTFTTSSLNIAILYGFISSELKQKELGYKTQLSGTLDIDSKYYIGNFAPLSKIFTDYYDDYLCEKQKICVTTTNN